MLTPGSPNRLLVIGTVVVLATVACSTDLGGPERPRLQPNIKPALSVVASELSVWDEDGTQYTLNVPAREIRMSDGRKLLLDEDQTNLAIEAFYGTIATDPVATDISTLTYDTGCSTPDSKVGCEAQIRILDPWEPVQAEPRSGPPSRARVGTSPQRPSGTAVPKLMWRRPEDSRRNKLPRRIQPHSRTRPSQPTAMNSTGSFAFASNSFFAGNYFAMSADPCTDVASLAVSYANQYFSKRTNYIKEIWPFAVAEAADWATRTIPRGTLIALKFADLVATHEASRIQVNILAFYWNSYNCSNRTVTVGPIYLGGGSGGGGGGGGGGMFCEYQTWKISFDNGQTWHGVSVHVCYAMQ